MKKKRALIVGTGGLRGAYGAGVVAELCRKLGPYYFDSLYASSVGTYAATFFVANQPGVIEDVWRNHVDGRKLIDYTNIFKNRAVLQLGYLARIFQNGLHCLDVNAVMHSRASLFYTLTEYATGKTAFITPQKNMIFDMMSASAAMPLLHPPKIINGMGYVDGSLSDPLPFLKALADGHDEVVVVYNKPSGFFVGNRYDTFSHLLAAAMPRKIGHLVRTV